VVGEVALWLLHAGAGARFLVMLLVGLLMGLEAASLWRWTLSRREWRQIDIVVADDEEAAERRFFDRWTAKQGRLVNDQSRFDRGGPPPTRDVPGQPFSRPPPPSHNEIIGLFPQPGGSGTMSVAIIDYGSGNLHSAAKAFERAARSMEGAEKIVVTRDPEVVFRADRVVLPGVARSPIAAGASTPSTAWSRALTETVRDKARPFFGICVGMQLIATRGKEHVITEGLNWIKGDVEKISPRDENLKVPHMGWNTLDVVREHPVLERLRSAQGPPRLFRAFLSSECG